ncbi:MAG TPA: phosphomannomutase/phosphoglucomutase, partial [Actinobacteria bacterium]|nr:phosphomannomutase/phosphoglucomutase [Actinomycetota bacterium]
IMFTASHNPAKYNGMKLCKSGARPIGQESGLLLIKEFIEKGIPISTRPVGKVTSKDLLSEYVDYLIKQFPKKTFSKQKLKVVIDAG